MSVMLDIKYDELNVESYSGIQVRGKHDVIITYRTGSVENDLKAAIRKAVEIVDDGIVMFSSSLDNFVMDADGEYEWYEDEIYGEVIRKTDKKSSD